MKCESCNEYYCFFISACTILAFLLIIFFVAFGFQAFPWCIPIVCLYSACYVFFRAKQNDVLEGYDFLGSLLKNLSYIFVLFGYSKTVYVYATKGEIESGALIPFEGLISETFGLWLLFVFLFLYSVGMGLEMAVKFVKKEKKGLFCFKKRRVKVK